MKSQRLDSPFNLNVHNTFHQKHEEEQFPSILRLIKNVCRGGGARGLLFWFEHLPFECHVAVAMCGVQQLQGLQLISSKQKEKKPIVPRSLLYAIAHD